MFIFVLLLLNHNFLEKSMPFGKDFFLFGGVGGRGRNWGKGERENERWDLVAEHCDPRN